MYFDLDFTLISYNGVLRPLTTQILAKLRSDGHHLYIWSGVGVRVQEVQGLGLFDLVNGVFEKPVERFEERLTELNIPVRPDAVVDDHAEIVGHFGGVHVRPFFWPDQNDRELERVYMQLTEIALRLGR